MTFSRQRRSGSVKLDALIAYYAIDCRLTVFCLGVRQVAVLEEIVFVQPPAGPNDDNGDTLVQGAVMLWLHTSRILLELTVRVVGEQAIQWPSHARPREASTILSRQIDLLEGKARQLDKGEHTFTFTISVPSTSAPYERCKWGKVKHAIVAKATVLFTMRDDAADVGHAVIRNHAATDDETTAAEDGSALLTATRAAVGRQTTRLLLPPTSLRP